MIFNSIEKQLSEHKALHSSTPSISHYVQPTTSTDFYRKPIIPTHSNSPSPSPSSQSNTITPSPYKTYNTHNTMTSSSQYNRPTPSSFQYNRPTSPSSSKYNSRKSRLSEMNDGIC